MLLSGFAFSTSDEIAELSGSSSSNPPNIGNFSLPSPQQPGPLLSFGQTLIGRNHQQLEYTTFSPFHVVGPFRNMNASIISGLTDSTSLYFTYPITSDSSTRSLHATAIGDVTLQLEHAFYTEGNRQYQEQATVVGAMTLPLQEVSPSRNKAIGYGSPTYFLGTTFNRTYVDWLVFVSPGAWFTTTSNNVRLGSQGLYQAGLGHTIVSVTDKSILFGLLELDGQYTYKDEVFKHGLPNTGGNVIALTPSISLATENLIAHVGVGFPVVQNLNGTQKLTDYFIAASFTLTIA